MEKVWVVTGPKGVGKSTALATLAKADEVKKVYVIDTEGSMSDIKDQITFGGYADMYKRISPDSKAGKDMLALIAAGKPPWVGDNQRSQWVAYYEYFVKRLNKDLVPGRYSHVLIDTIGPIEAAMAAAVDAGRKVFGWGGSPAYGKSETEGVRPLYEGLLEAIGRRGVKNIAIASHIKPVWAKVGGNKSVPIPGKVKPGGRMAVLARLSTAMFWLVHEPMNASGAPAAIVLKARIGKHTVDGATGHWITQRVLPARMPEFSWLAVDRYKEEPANFANPAPGEIPTAEELEMASELLNQAQYKLMVLGAQERLAARPVRQADAMLVPTVTDGAGQPDLRQARVLALAVQGMDAMAISKEVGMPPMLVKGMLEAARSQ